MIGKLPIPQWSSLRKFGKSPIAQTSYFWFVLTPLAARALEHLPKQLTFPIGSTQIPIDLALPFSWVIFFFAALALSIGQLIFTVNCPAIIRDYISYAQFKEQGKGLFQLVEYLKRTLEQLHGNILFVRYETLKDSAQRRQAWIEVAREIHGFGESFFGQNVSFRAPGYSPDEKRIGSTPWDDEKLSRGLNQLVGRQSLPRENEAFWRVYYLADDSSPRVRLACIIAYGVGLLLLGIVLLQNVIFVLRHMPHQ